MAVQIDELITDVSIEPEPSGGGGQGGMRTWDSAENTRAGYIRWMRDRARTAAWGFDD